MTGVTDPDPVAGDVVVAEEVDEVDLFLLPALAVAVVVGVALAWTARIGATPLLVAVAVVQALLALAWVFGTRMPGRIGGLVIAAMASAAADVCVSVWPHGRLGPLLAVLGLAVPVMFVHQLTRGAARVQVVSSMSAVAVLVTSEVALASALQLRHEFGGAALGGKVAAAALAALAGAIVVGCLVDLVLPAPRFDPEVPRGLLGLIAATGLGACLGYLMLRRQADFLGGRAAFVGAALGALAGLVAVAAAFVLHSTTPAGGGVASRLRPVLGAVLPIAVLAPVAFLLCLAIRS
jgi:hypothetical protein